MSGAFSRPRNGGRECSFHLCDADRLKGSESYGIYSMFFNNSDILSFDSHSSLF